MRIKTMGASAELIHPYEIFASCPEIEAIDKYTVGQILPGHVIFDIGSGPGDTVQRLFDRGILLPPFQVHGVDIDPTAIERARRRFSSYASGVNEEGQIDFHLVKGDEKFPFPDNSFDRITALNMIHNAGVEFILREIFRLLKPRGQAVISSAYGELSIPEGTAGLWGRSPAYALQELRETGIIRPEDKPSHKKLFDTSDKQYEDLADEIGFVGYKSWYETVLMKIDGSVKAIFSDPEFVKGTFHGLIEIIEERHRDIDAMKVLTDALVRARIPAYEKIKESLAQKYSHIYGEELDGSLPRRWKITIVEKPLENLSKAA